MANQCLSIAVHYALLYHIVEMLIHPQWELNVCSKTVKRCHQLEWPRAL